MKQLSSRPSKRQAEILKFIEDFQEANQYSPSLEEIATHFGISIPTVHQHISYLKAKNLISSDKGKRRSIETLHDNENDIAEIPLLGLIAAGNPIEAIKTAEPLQVPRNMLSSSGRHYALKVAGRSMIDEGIFDGDIVVVREQQTAENGEKVVALVNGDEATLKKFYFENDKVRLQPANPSFPPIFPDDVTIQGKVVGVINQNDIAQQHTEDRTEKKSLDFVSDGTSTIFNDDCLNVLKSIKDESVDLIFADPPYNIGKDFGNGSDKWNSLTKYLEWCQEWINECVRVLKPNGTFYLMNATQHMPYLDVYLSSKLSIVNRIIWFYDSSGVQAKSRFGSLYEPILMAVKNEKSYKFNHEDIMVEAKTGAKRKLIDYRKKVPTPYNTKKIPGNVWYFPRVRFRMEEYENHPTQKPEALLERIILASSSKGDTVLDPFAGSFTTCAVARKNDRKTIGIELSKEYFKIGLRRLGLANEYRGEKLLKTKERKTNNRSKKDHQQSQLSFLKL